VVNAIHICAFVDVIVYILLSFDVRVWNTLKSM